MKRLLLIICALIILSGCSFKDTSNFDSTYSVKYNDDYYTIYMPYKKGVGKNYILNSNVVDFDLNTIEKNLIQISANEFDIYKYYYQEGQYLTQKRLKKLLNNENLNKTSVTTIDGKKVKPQFIAGIFEKNFLNKDGELKGLSLGIVLNPYQAYDSNGNYVKYDEKKLIDFGKEKSAELVEYIRDELDIKYVPILVALYVESSPETSVSGDYLYYGVTLNYDIEFNNIDQKKYYMNNSKVKESDKNSYNNFKKIEESIREYDNSIYVSGLGYYSGGKLTKLDIVVTKSYYSHGELLYISQLISENILKYFDDTKVVVDIKAINDIQAYVVKNAGETSTDIFIY